jgi:siroheme synthase-like protein
MYYPVHLDVRGRSCLVVGGGRIARHKARSLRKAGAEVTVVAPEISGAFPGCTVVRRRFRPSDLRGVALAIGATDDAAANGRLSKECRRRNIPVNIVDQPELCSFIVPSVFRRGPLTIAISTGGASPALSKAIRRELERLYPKSFAKLAARLGEERRRVMRTMARSRTRTRLLIRRAESTLAEARGKRG